MLTKILRLSCLQFATKRIRISQASERSSHAFFKSSLKRSLAETPSAQSLPIVENVTPHDNKPQTSFAVIVEQSLTTKLLQQIKKKEHSLRTFSYSVLMFADFMKIFKESLIPLSFHQVKYKEYQNIWMEAQKHIDNSVIQQKLIKVWKLVPYHLLKEFVNSFQLVKLYQSFPVAQFLDELKSGLSQSKIQQSCEYYRIYKLNNKQIDKDMKKLQKFEAENLIPLIMEKELLFTDQVLALMKEDESICRQVLAVIDQKQYEKLVEIDRQKYEKLIKYTKTYVPQVTKEIENQMKSFYGYMIQKYSKWYLIEDKISSNRVYIKWYTDQLLKNASKQKNTQQAQKIVNSILFRAGILPKLTHQQIKNPLYEIDEYAPAKLHIQRIKGSTKQSQDYYRLKNSEKIHFIDKINQSFNEAQKLILSANVVGFDCEFLIMTNKREQGGVSIIQLAAKSEIFIFDYLILKKSEKFNQFFVKLMENGSIMKVGNSVLNDVRQLQRTFSLKMKIQNLVDIGQLFRTLYPNETRSSLQFMTEYYMKKKLCKYEQISNWSRRPLKKTQLHYAAADAFVCLQIYDKLKHVKVQKEEKNVQVKISKEAIPEKTVEEKDEREFNFQKFKDYLGKPLFIVDYMLNQLFKTMVNSGFDVEYLPLKDHTFAVNKAGKEKRIIVTLSSKFMKKNPDVPIYLVKQINRGLMFQELQQAFSLESKTGCDKCYSPDIFVISAEQARSELHFSGHDFPISEFWRCSRCRQIYWEGGQFLNEGKREALLI